MTEPGLAPEPDLAMARAIVAGYGAAGPEQRELRRRILDWIEEHPTDAHRRTCLAGHLTASTLLWDAAGERVLLHHHRKLDRWLQFGGHCDGDANLRGVAWRETVEESGIEPARFSAAPVDLDIHPIPARGAEPEHLHLDVRYLASAPPGALPACSEESRELRWLAPDQARALGVDTSVTRLLDLGPPR